MVVDDDNVAFHPSPAHFRNKASFPLAAFLSGAGFGTSIKLVPEQARFGQFSQFSAITGGRVLFPSRDCPILLDFLEAAQHRLVRQVIQLLAAEIIVSTLHVADRESRSRRRVFVEGLLKKGNIFVEKLL